MSRKERRAAAARDRATANGPATDVDALLQQASLAYERGDTRRAEDLCKLILARSPAHVGALNLFGLLAQNSGRHKLAIRMFEKALASEPQNGACHYNIGSSLQLNGQVAEAATHFEKAIVYGLGGSEVEELILANPAVAACAQRIAEKFTLRIGEQLIRPADRDAIAKDIFLRCSLATSPIRGAVLEAFLTQLRAALLRDTNLLTAAPEAINDEQLALSCALAEQCFINEYVFAVSEEEARLAAELRKTMQGLISAGAAVPPGLIAAVASYDPLHQLNGARSLLDRQWPQSVLDLLRHQIQEPLEEEQGRSAIPALTAIDDAISLQVMQQYDENPYPRWITHPPLARAPGSGGNGDILIAGCGTGRHAFQVAQSFPDSRILAIDISRASLAYAQRKTRNAGLRNIEYAQADILKLETIGRAFDRIEAVGVLHHLAAPEDGWRALLALLRPAGVMRVGLYSEAARSAIAAARAIVAAQRLRPIPDDIRRFRQFILRDSSNAQWKRITTDADFYSMSGCRDLLFNVQEHRFTIPRIAAFLAANSLAFMGFDLDPAEIERFRAVYPGDASLNDLDKWHAFEAANPQMFRHMYVFSVRKR